MKKLILLAGVASLAACTEPAVEEEAPAEDVAMEGMAEEEAPTAPDGGPLAGSYEVTRGDQTWVTTINDDMTYSQTMDGEQTVTGTMRMSDATTACFDTDGDDEGEICFKSEIGEDGTWTSTGPDGEPATVVRVES